MLFEDGDVESSFLDTSIARSVAVTIVTPLTDTVNGTFTVVACFSFSFRRTWLTTMLGFDFDNEITGVSTFGASDRAGTPGAVMGLTVNGTRVSVADLDFSFTVLDFAVATITGLKSGMNESSLLFTATTGIRAGVPFGPGTNTVSIAEFTGSTRETVVAVAHVTVGTIVMTVTILTTVGFIARVYAFASGSQVTILAHAGTIFTMSKITTANTITYIVMDLRL